MGTRRRSKACQQPATHQGRSKLLIKVKELQRRRRRLAEGRREDGGLQRRAWDLHAYVAGAPCIKRAGGDVGCKGAALPCLALTEAKESCLRPARPCFHMRAGAAAVAASGVCSAMWQPCTHCSQNRLPSPCGCASLQPCFLPTVLRMTATGSQAGYRHRNAQPAMAARELAWNCGFQSGSGPCGTPSRRPSAATCGAEGQGVLWNWQRGAGGGEAPASGPIQPWAGRYQQGIRCPLLHKISPLPSPCVPATLTEKSAQGLHPPVAQRRGPGQRGRRQRAG